VQELHQLLLIFLFKKFISKNHQTNRFNAEKLKNQFVLKLYEVIFYSSGFLKYSYLNLFKQNFKALAISKNKQIRLQLKLMTGK
jgi:hypothetical protein